MKTLILGAGLSGLTTGRLLKQRGLAVEILEKEVQCGGLMRTLDFNGFVFDYAGSHILFSKNKKALDFLLSVLGTNKVKNKRNTKVLYHGRLVKYPFENGLSNLPKSENFECLNSYIKNIQKKEKHELNSPKNLKDWFSYTFGEAIAQKYLLPYNTKIWKAPCETLSIEWVERIPSPPIEDVIKSSLGLNTEGYTHQLHFYYPKVGGIQAVIDRLEKNLKGSITCGFDVKSVNKENGKWRISDGKTEKTCDKLVSTIPIQRLLKAIDSPRNIMEAANDLKYNSLITIMIGLKSKLRPRLSWLYIPDSDILTHRVSFPSNYSPCTAPLGHSSVMAEVTCRFQDTLWRTSEDEISKRVIDDLHELKVIDKQNVAFAVVKKTELAYVINDLSYTENVKKVKEYCAEQGIGLVGRFSEFKYLNMDDCVLSAMNYVDKI